MTKKIILMFFVLFMMVKTVGAEILWEPVMVRASDGATQITITGRSVTGTNFYGEQICDENGSNCADISSGIQFNPVDQDNITWSDGSNASNTWTFDVSGTDTTIIFGNGIMTFSGDIITSQTIQPVTVSVNTASPLYRVDIHGAADNTELLRVHNTNNDAGTATTSGIILSASNSVGTIFTKIAAIEDTADGANVNLGLYTGTGTGSAPVEQFRVGWDGEIYMYNIDDASGNWPLEYNTTSKEVTYDSSAEFTKENMQPHGVDTSKIWQLNLKKYNRLDSIKTEYGFGALETEGIMPELVLYMGTAGITEKMVEKYGEELRQYVRTMDNGTLIKDENGRLIPEDPTIKIPFGVSRKRQLLFMFEEMKKIIAINTTQQIRLNAQLLKITNLEAENIAIKARLDKLENP